LQPTQIILLQNDNAALKDQVADQVMLGAGNQFRMRDCSAAAIFLSDLEANKRIQRIYQLEQEWGGRHPTYQAMMPLSATFLIGEGHAALFAKQIATGIMSEIKPVPMIEPVQAWAYKNTAMLVQSFVLAATSHDLATTVMEGFDPRRAKELLRIPDRYEIPMMVAMGYDYEERTGINDEEDYYTPRLPLEDVVFANTFGEPYNRGADDEENHREDDDDDDVAASV
jgi:nitroreductase